MQNNLAFVLGEPPLPGNRLDSKRGSRIQFPRVLPSRMVPHQQDQFLHIINCSVRWQGSLAVDASQSGCARIFVQIAGRASPTFGRLASMVASVPLCLAGWQTATLFRPRRNVPPRPRYLSVRTILDPLLTTNHDQLEESLAGLAATPRVSNGVPVKDGVRLMKANSFCGPEIFDKLRASRSHRYQKNSQDIC